MKDSWTAQLLTCMQAGMLEDALREDFQKLKVALTQRKLCHGL